MSLAQCGDQHDAANVLKGFGGAGVLEIKTGLVIEIRHAMRRLGLTQQTAAKQTGVTQPKVSDMMRGRGDPCIGPCQHSRPLGHTSAR